MTDVPPQRTMMGRLSLDTVFIRFDGPRLFSCRSESGRYYLGLFVDEDESTETFAYAPVTEARLAAIRSGHLPLRAAYEEPLDNGVFVVRASLLTTDEDVSWLPTAEIPPEWLPSPEVRLEIDTPTQDPLRLSDMENEARALQRTLAAFELDTPLRTTEFPLRSLSEVMRLVQEAVDSFGQVVREMPTNRGAVQQVILDHSELTLYDVRAASFAFVVASAPSPRLFEDPLVSEALNLLVQLMDAAGSEDELSGVLLNLHPRALSKYRDLLEELDDVDSGLGAIVAPPDVEARSSRLTKELVSRSLSSIRARMEGEIEEIVVEAELIGTNARTRTFELLDIATHDKYSGKAIDEAKEQLIGLTIGERYRVKLLREAEIEPVTGELKYKYRLQSFQDPGQA